MLNENMTDDHNGFDGECEYVDLASRDTIKLHNSILHLNIRSLPNKINELEALLNMFDSPKVIMLSETWLTVNTSLLNINNYFCVSSPRLQRGGGVAMYLHNSVQYSVKLKSCERVVDAYHNIDFLILEILSLNITLCCMYCPPNTNLAHILTLIEHLKSKSNPRTSFVIGGDFNINLLASDTELSLEFLNSIHALGLHPIITLATRVTNTTSTLIDNFLCDINLLPLCSSVIKTDISDHFIIEFKLAVSAQANLCTKRSFTLKNRANFTNKLSNANWELLYTINDADIAFTYFLKKLKRIYNKAFPFKTVPICQKSNPWLTSGILKSIKQKYKLFQKAKVNLNDSDWQRYKTYRNCLTKIIRNAKINYHKQLLASMQNNSAKLWSHLNSLIKTNNKPNIPLHADVLNNFFTSIFLQAPPYQSDRPHTLTRDSFITKSLFLAPITCIELISTITSLSNSQSVGVDGLTSDIIKSNATLIAQQLTYIFNLSFSEGVFPNLLKNAIVVPIYKSGVHNDPGNYRPISILTVFSKLLEKLFYNRLNSFINKNNILHSNQCGFCKNKSTSLAIGNVLSSLINKCNSNKKVAFALLDLKKAFDFINHDLLLVKLKHYGIRGLPLKWITSYLHNRTQKCKVDGSFSAPKPISAGVPQGSILGPVLFNLFINDVFQFNATNIEIYLYADDTAVIFSADSNSELQTLVDKFFVRYANWCNLNCIVVNPTKSNYLLFNSENVVLTIDGHVLDIVHVVKYLGVLIDDKLSWSFHINHITRLCCQRIGVFKKILPCLPNYVSVLYYNAFIRSCFSYCTLYWFNNPRSGRYKLINKIDNLIAVMADKQKLSVPTFISKYRIFDVWKVYKLQCFVFMFDICNNLVMFPYINLSVNNLVHEHYTRTSINLHVNVISSIDKRNFIYNCILVWNTSPIDTRLLPKYLFLSACKQLIFAAS